MTPKWLATATPDKLEAYARFDEMTKEGNAGKRRIRHTCLQRAAVRERLQSTAQVRGEDGL